MRSRAKRPATVTFAAFALFACEDTAEDLPDSRTPDASVDVDLGLRTDTGLPLDSAVETDAGLQVDAGTTWEEEPGPGGRVPFEVSAYIELVDVDPRRANVLVRTDTELWDVDLVAVEARLLTRSYDARNGAAVYRGGGVIFVETSTAPTIRFDRGPSQAALQLAGDHFIPLSDAFIVGGPRAQLVDLATLDRRTLGEPETARVSGRPRDHIDTVLIETTTQRWMYVRRRDALVAVPETLPGFRPLVLEGGVVTQPEVQQQILTTVDGTLRLQPTPWRISVRTLCTATRRRGYVRSTALGTPQRARDLNGSPINVIPTQNGCMFHHRDGIDWLSLNGTEQSLSVPDLGRFVHSTWPDAALIAPTMPPTLIIDPIGLLPLAFVDVDAPIDRFPNFLRRIADRSAVMVDFQRSRLQRIDLDTGAVRTLYDRPDWREPSVSIDGRWMLAVESAIGDSAGIPFVVDLHTGERTDLAPSPERIVSLGFTHYNLAILPRHAVYLVEDGGDDGAAAELVIVPLPGGEDGG